MVKRRGGGCGLERRRRELFLSKPKERKENENE
jgi:hypothetical protein